MSHNQMGPPCWRTPGWNDLPFHNPDKINTCICNAALLTLLTDIIIIIIIIIIIL
jgi:hypothetical protein